MANVPSSPVPGGTGLSTGFTSGSTMSPWSSWYGRSPPDAVVSMVAATITRFRSWSPGQSVSGHLGSFIHTT